MNLVWFLTIATLFSLILGEFGQFPFASSSSISLTDLMLSLTIGFLLIWQVIKKKLEINFEFKILILFWFLSLISLFFSQEFRGGLYLLRFILYSTSFWLGYVLVKERQVSIEVLSKYILFLGFILSILGFIQLIFLPNLDQLALLGYDPHQGRLVATFLDPNFLGIFLNLSLAMGLFLYLQTKNKLYLVFLATIFLALILTFSRTAYLMFLIQTFLVGALKLRKLLLILLIVLLLSFFLVPRFAERVQGGLKIDQSASQRFTSWQQGLSIFQQSPIIGVGFNNLRENFEKNNFFKAYQQNNTNSGSGVDSSGIVVLATTGIAGFIIYCVWWILILKKSFLSFIKKKKILSLIFFSTLTGLLISSNFINSLFFPSIMLIIYLLAGAFIADRESNA